MTSESTRTLMAFGPFGPTYYYRPALPYAAPYAYYPPMPYAVPAWGW